MPRKNLIDWSINLSFDKTLGWCTLLPLPSINCIILIALSCAAFINSGIIEIIEETNNGLIPLPLICQSLWFFITSFEILFPRAIYSNSRWCFSSSFVF